MGRSNVGKSSLINAILKRKDLARVSQTPGKTQAIQFYLINEQFYIVDLPGYGYAKVPRSISSSWGELTREFFESSTQLRMLFLLLDARREPSEEDQQMLAWARAAAVPTQLVLTKVDKLSNNQLAKSRSMIVRQLDAAGEEVIEFSKMTRQGVDRIWRAINRARNPETEPVEPAGPVD